MTPAARGEFSHSREVWNDSPQLVAGALAARGINDEVNVQPRLSRFTARADARLVGHTEGELPEIEAWRGAFAQMGHESA